MQIVSIAWLSNPVFLVIKKKKKFFFFFFFFVVCWNSPDSGNSMPASTKCYNFRLVYNQEDSA